MGTDKTEGCGVLILLARLLRSRRGNTFALIAGVLFPLLGLLGGGIDMSRLYLTKTRLQHACDAGALAGRKAMGGASWTTTGTGNTQSVALAMFDGNFQQGDYGTGVRTRSFTESDGAVAGVATVSVPMTVMRVFGFSSRDLTINCTAKMAIPNTDVMFVLDVTGSMSCAPGTSGGGCSITSTSKITGLKSAVKCFYEALMKVNTSEVCGNDPTATTYNGSAQIRFGFVPYSVNVNVGKLLPNDYLADVWNYQTRVWGTAYSKSTSQSGWSVVSGTTSLSTVSYSGKISNCPSGDYNSNDVNGTPTAPVTANNGTITYTYTVTRTETGTSHNCYTGNNNNKYDDKTTYNNYVTRSTVTVTKTPYPGWVYKQAEQTVSGLKAGGSSWNNSVSLPLGLSGSNTNISWDGCIEERKTVKNTDGDPSDEWNPIPAEAYDMDIDMVPSSTAGSKWGPLINGAVYPRYDENGNQTLDETYTSYGNPSSNGSYYCPVQAKKLQTWNTPSDFVTYVNSLSPTGNTYHDIGMIWGARFISPTGIFATENTNLSKIERHIIFMTDGDTTSYNDDYTAYGISWWDRRQTDYAPANGNGSNSDTAKIVNAHLAGLCTAIKNKNITLWVISYGGSSAINTDTDNRLRACATSGKYFPSSDTATLISNFKQIADQISQLRLTN